MKAMLRWLVGCMVPLSLEEIAEAISITSNDTSFDEDAVATDPASLGPLLGCLIIVQELKVDHNDGDMKQPGSKAVNAHLHEGLPSNLENRHSKGSGQGIDCRIRQANTWLFGGLSVRDTVSRGLNETELV